MFRTFIRNISTSNILHITVKPPIPVFGVEGRYVSALYSAASQTKELEDVEKALKTIQKELTKPIMKDFLITSLITKAGKVKILKEIAKEVGMPKTAINFLGLVAENGRLKLLNRMIQKFLTVMVAHRKEIMCEIITATPLKTDDRNAILAALKAIVKSDQKIRLTENVNESIIGGLIVGIGDSHIDLSLSKKIKFYSEVMKKSV